MWPRTTTITRTRALTLSLTTRADSELPAPYAAPGNPTAAIESFASGEDIIRMVRLVLIHSRTFTGVVTLREATQVQRMRV